MRHTVIILGFMCVCASIIAQPNNRIQRVAIPTDESASATSLASSIAKRYTTPHDRLQAAYQWVISNITYNTDSSLYFDQAVDHEEKIAAIMRRRKGVCEHYAVLFVELANKMDIPAHVVRGLARDIGNSTAHSWAAVQLNNQWFLCDPTWDASGRTYVFYLADPGFFAQTHLPFDPIWQLLEKPHGYKMERKQLFNFNDSISSFMQLDSLQKFVAIDRRMKNMQVDRLLYKTWASYNKMNIIMIAGEEDRRLYNEAVEYLNEAKEMFNGFVHYRNRQFTPKRPDAAINAMLAPIKKKILDSKNATLLIGSLAPNYQYNTSTLLQQLDALEKRTNEQLDFLKTYFATQITERESLFLVK